MKRSRFTEEQKQGSKVRMKQLLGFALNFMVVALTPTIGNAADMIVAECTLEGKITKFIFDISGGKQILPDLGEGKITFTKNSIIVTIKLFNKDSNIVFNFKNNQVLDSAGRDLKAKCEYKNLELIKKAILIQNYQPGDAGLQEKMQYP